MEYIPIPDDEIVPMDRIADCVHGLRVVMVNVYGICDSSDGWILVDGGLKFSEGRIRRWAEENFAGQAPKYILLTHGHFDHVGAIEDLVGAWDVPIYAHSRELPYLTGQSEYPPPDPSVGGGLMAFLAKLYPRGPIDLGDRVRPLPDDGTVPGLPDWRWIHTPGHTRGHVSLFRQTGRVLIAGDAFVTTKQEALLAVATQRAELHGPPAYYTPDWESARGSVERLAQLRPLVVATGHGKAVGGPEVADELEALANNFDKIARPAHGRYVEAPVRAV